MDKDTNYPEKKANHNSLLEMTKKFRGKSSKIYLNDPPPSLESCQFVWSVGAVETRERSGSAPLVAPRPDGSKELERALKDLRAPKRAKSFHGHTDNLLNRENDVSTAV